MISDETSAVNQIGRAFSNVQNKLDRGNLKTIIIEGALIVLRLRFKIVESKIRNDWIFLCHTIDFVT